MQEDLCALRHYVLHIQAEKEYLTPDKLSTRGYVSYATERDAFLNRLPMPRDVVAACHSRPPRSF